MAQRIGKYKLSKKEQAIYEHDVDTATFSEIDITGTFEADGLCSAKGGLTVTGAALTVTGQTATFAAAATVGTTLAISGVTTATGGIVAGTDGVTRGTLSLFDGSGGNTAGYIVLYSRNGTANYIFCEDDGTLKRHTSAPAANSDGSEVGGQT